jgi:hypothetical protein
MSVANIFEITKCLADSVAYCEKNPTSELGRFFQPRLTEAARELEEALKATDGHFTNWRMEAGDDRLAWKHLSNELARAQTRLNQIGAMDFPDQKLKYWDEEILQGVVLEMIAYLKSRASVIDFANEQAEKLERQLERCFSEHQTSNAALRTYTRNVQRRSDAISNSTNTIASFRQTMRRELGKDHPDYRSIRWPFAVATDDPVL